MPFSLYHGPAGQEKIQALWQVLNTNHFLCDKSENFILVTANHGFVSRYKRELASQTKQKLIMGRTVLTFDDFLLQLVKLNCHRVHLADDTFSLYLLFLLIMRRAGVYHDVSAIVSEAHVFFLHLKKCGLTPEVARKFLYEHLDDPTLLDLFADYQNELRKRYYYDPADLYLTTMECLRGKNFKWLEDISHIYVTGIYPLHAGQREILRLLKHVCPDVHIHVFYDEDHTRADDLLSQAYEDLGALADHTEALPNLKMPPQPVLEFNTAHEEILFASTHVRKLLTDGVPPHDIVIIANPEYHELLEIELMRHNIPFSLRNPISVRKTLPSQDLLNQLTARKDFPELLIRQSRQDNIFAQHKLQALAALEQHRERISFLTALLKDLHARVDENGHIDFLEFLERELKFRSGATELEIAITDFQNALALNDKHLIVLGFHLENIQTYDNQTFYSPHLYTRREFAELLNSPIYQYKIALERLRQLVLTTKNLTLTRARADFSGKPTTAIAFDNITFTPIIGEDSQPKFKTENENKIYAPVTNKSVFSISEIQCYMKCPQQYYMGKWLKLTAIDKDDVEPPSDARGTFAHLVLQKLIEEQYEIYVAALRDKSAFAELAKALNTIISFERKNFVPFKNFSDNLAAPFADRLQKAILSVVTKESTAWCDGEKTTLPNKMEWEFTYAKKRGYELNTPIGPITLSGRIDRIDIDKVAHTFSVIDYKTGSFVPATTAICAGQEIQLPLYMMAVEENLFPGFSPSGGFYHDLMKGKIVGFGIKGTTDVNLVAARCQIPPLEWDEVKVRVTQNVVNAVAGIRAGHFAPKPRKDSECVVCDFQKICTYRPTDAEPDAEET